MFETRKKKKGNQRSCWFPLKKKKNVRAGSGQLVKHAVAAVPVGKPLPPSVQPTSPSIQTPHPDHPDPEPSAPVVTQNLPHKAARR